MSSHKTTTPVYAIFRWDDFVGIDDPKERCSVVRIVWSQSRADEEVSRLNELNGEKGTRYFWRLTRLEPTPS